MKKQNSSLRSRSNTKSIALFTALFLILGFVVGACGSSSDEPRGQAQDPRVKDIVDESKPLDERIAFVEALERPVPQDVVEALLRVMKDRSQQAFITTPDDSELGYITEESPFGGPDTRAPLRWTAIEALERLGEKQALPDLISALYDRDPVVRHYAARALWRFGSAEGLPVLLKGLEGKALSNESANRVLQEISGRDFGFNTDSGWQNKKAAIDRWNEYAKSMKPDAPFPKAGEDPDLDRRVRYLVAILGQHQFLFMEQARRGLSQLGELGVVHIKNGLDNVALGKTNQQLRAYALQALALNNSESAQKLIVDRFTVDTSAPVRSRSAIAMGNMSSADSKAALLRLIDDKDESVVLAASSALGKRGIAEAAPRLKKFFEEPRRTERWRLLIALALIQMGEKNSLYAGLIEKTMVEGKEYVKIELESLLREWKGELFGWSAKSPVAENREALAKWRAILYE